MCLSTVFMLKSQSGEQPGEERELISKNIASISCENGELILKNVLGIPTRVKGEIAHVDLVENFVYVRPKS